MKMHMTLLPTATTTTTTKFPDKHELEVIYKTFYFLLKKLSQI